MQRRRSWAVLPLRVGKAGQKDGLQCPMKCSKLVFRQLFAFHVIVTLESAETSLSPCLPLVRNASRGNSNLRAVASRFHSSSTPAREDCRFAVFRYPCSLSTSPSGDDCGSVLPMKRRSARSADLQGKCHPQSRVSLIY